MDGKLVVTEIIESGFLGGSDSVHFDFYDENVMFKITVEQYLARTITIFAADNKDTSKLLSLYYRIKIILFFQDGQFFQVEKAVENDVDITHSLIKRELPYFKSADFMVGRGNLLNGLNILSSDSLSKWSSIQSDLDISFRVMLYCVSNIKLPVDMKCAFLIETFIPLAETISNVTVNFKLPKINKDKHESKLQKYLMAVITSFGRDVFCKDSSTNIETITNILKNSRNRIAHVKQKQNQVVLSGAQSVFYLYKLALLYRVILLNLIGIPYKCYQDKLIENVKALDLNHRNK